MYCTPRRWVETLRAVLMDQPVAGAVNSNCVTHSITTMARACRQPGGLGPLQRCMDGVVMGNNRLAGFANRGPTTAQSIFSGVRNTYPNHNIMVVGHGEGWSPERRAVVP